MRTSTGRYPYPIILVLCLCVHAFGQASDPPKPDRDSTATLRADRVSAAVAALAPDALEVVSLGQPTGRVLTWGLVTGPRIQASEWMSRLFLCAHNRIGMSQLGALKISAEAALVTDHEVLDGAAGLYFNIFGLRSGLEYNGLDEDLTFRLSTDIVLRRGGLFGRGERLRLEYDPSTKTLLTGVSFRLPIIDYRRNRPRDAGVRFTPGSRRSLTVPDRHLPTSGLEPLKAVMFELDRLLTPTVAQAELHSERGRDRFAHGLEGLRGSPDSTCSLFGYLDSSYHALLEQALTKAADLDREQGRRLALLAERSLLQDFVLPINRTLGQKKRPLDFSGLAETAARRFEERLETAWPGWSDERRFVAGGVFTWLLDRLSEVAMAAKRRWDDDRLIWLPLNYGLRPEQYDSQDELNLLVEDVIGRRFTHTNDIQLLFNDRWHYELERMILETEYYHVLVIHDYRARDVDHPDPVGWGLSADGYIEAFIHAIEDLDAGRRSQLPQFHIFLDEFYYDRNTSRKVIDHLEHLIDPDKMDTGDSTTNRRLQRAHERLRDAIRQSPRLRDLPEDRLAKLIKVHINVTNVFDPVFSEDVIARDHRKIAFRDIFEADPARGEAIFTGQGVGAHYLGPCWDDRSLRVRGADLVHLKSATRELFLSQGYGPAQVPYYLQARPFPADYEVLCAELRRQGWTANVLHAMNETGYGQKSATLVKAVLYNLMLAGSLIVAPDSIWTSDFWAGMLISAALRGCQVYVIAPAHEQAPSNAAPTLELVRNTLAAIWEAARLLQRPIAASGGALHVGIYTKSADVNDLTTAMGDMLRAFREHSHLGGVRGLHPATLGALQDEYRQLVEHPPQVRHIVAGHDPCNPKLHHKTQFFANAHALEIFKDRDLSDGVRAYFRARKDETSGIREPGTQITPRLLSEPRDPEECVTEAASAADGLSATVTAPSGEGPIAAWTIGSHNQDRRSFMLDGEALVIVTGEDALISVIDFAMIMGASRWVESLEELESMFPQTQSLWRRVSSWLKNLI